MKPTTNTRHMRAESRDHSRTASAKSATQARKAARALKHGGRS